MSRRRVVRFLFLAFLLVRCASTPAPDLEPAFTQIIRDDARHFAIAPLSWEKKEWTALGLGAVAVGATILIDEDVREAIDGASNRSTQSLADAVEPFGAEYSWGVLGAFYLAGRYDSRARAVAQDGFAASAIAAGAITPILKATVGRKRPSQTEGTFAFADGGASFPSGHTTQAFAIASVVASHYESPWVKWGAYGVAALVAWARLENRAHYASDVIAGAAIGTLVGRTVVRVNRERRFNIGLAPSLDPAAPGVALTIRASPRRR